MKVVYIPVDDRPCNYIFPGILAKSSEIELVVPPMDMLGKRKKPADLKELWEWLFSEIKEADGLIISMDMILYGGLVPSRVHHQQVADFALYFERIKRLKELNPALVIYGFQLVMRCPGNSAGFEEPDYYEFYGKEIFTLGQLTDKEQRGIATPQELEDKERLTSEIPQEHLRDYLDRRQINLQNNFKTIELIREGLFDYFIFPQDDTSQFGYSYFDQEAVGQRIASSKIANRTIMYPGTDEIGCTLLTRMLNHSKKKTIKIYPKFSSALGPLLTPLYEDRPLLETVKSTITACGGVMVGSEEIADVVFIINSPGEMMIEAANQLEAEKDTKKNLPELMTYIEYLVTQEKTVTIADSSYANGGDIDLFDYLHQFNLLDKLSGYAGWNTNSNTLGTALSFGVFSHYSSNKNNLTDFLMLRYLEDIAYSSIIRQALKATHADKIGTNQANLGELSAFVAEEAKDSLQEFANNFLTTNTYQVKIKNCQFPWERMFEIDIKLAVEEL